MAFMVAAGDPRYGAPLGKTDTGIVKKVPFVTDELEAVVVTRVQVSARVSPCDACDALDEWKYETSLRRDKTRLTRSRSGAILLGPRRYRPYPRSSPRGAGVPPPIQGRWPAWYHAKAS